MQTLSLMFFSTLLCGGRFAPLHEEHCVAYYKHLPIAFFAEGLLTPLHEEHCVAYYEHLPIAFFAEGG